MHPEGNAPIGATHRGAQRQIRLLLMVTGAAVPEVEHRFGGFYALFERGLKAGGQPLDLVAAPVDTSADAALALELEGIDGVVVTGSPAFIGEGALWMHNSALRLAEIVQLSIPLLAVCFGHQLLGLALGADVGPNPPGYAIGTRLVHLSGHHDDALLGGLGPQLCVNLSHHDAVRVAGPRLQTLGRAAHDGHQAIKAGPWAWGLQFHPEFDAEVVRAYIRSRAEVIAEQQGPAEVQRLLNQATDTPEAASLLPRFAALCAQRALNT